MSCLEARSLVHINETHHALFVHLKLIYMAECMDGKVGVNLLREEIFADLAILLSRNICYF